MALTIIWAAGVMAVGWAAVRWGWPAVGGRAADVAWGIAPAAGLAVVLLTANVFAYVFPVALAAGLGTALVAAVLAAALLMRHTRSVPTAAGEAAADRDATQPDAADLVLWLIAGLVVTAVVGAGAFASLIYDEELQHWPLIATIAAGNFPPQLPFWPAWPAVYHYGFDLLAAAVHRLSGLPIWWAIDVMTVLVAPAVFWSVAALLRRAGASTAYALVGAVFVFFGGGWVPAWFAQRIPYWLTYAEGPLAGMKSEPMLVGNLFNSFALIVHSHPPALGFVCLLAYAHGWITMHRSQRMLWGAVVLTVLVGAAAALASSSEFLLLLLGSGAVTSLRAAQLARRALSRRQSATAAAEVQAERSGAFGGDWWEVMRDGGLVLATAALGLASGGALSDLLFRARNLPLGPSLGWRGMPGWPLLTGDVVGLNVAWWWDLLLAEFGLPLLLLPVVLWWCFRHPTPLKTWLLMTAAIGMALPLVFRYERADYDIARFARTAGYLWLVLCALTAVELSRGRQWPRLIYALGGLFVLGSTYMGLSFAISLWSPEGLKAQSPDVPPAQAAMARRVAAVVPPSVWVLSDNPQWVAALAGRLAPSTLAPHFINGDTGDYQAALAALDASAIERLGVAYLHISSALYTGWPEEIRAALRDSGRFDLLTHTEGRRRCDGLVFREWVALYGIVGRYETAGGGPRLSAIPPDPTLATWEPPPWSAPKCD